MEVRPHQVEIVNLQMAARYVQNSNEMEDAHLWDAPLLPLEITPKPGIKLSETFIL